MGWRRLARHLDGKTLVGIAALLVAIPVALMVINLANTNAERNARGQKIYELVKRQYAESNAARVQSARERRRLISQNGRVLDELAAVRAHEQALVEYLRSHGIRVPVGFRDTPTTAPPARPPSSPKVHRGSGPAPHKSSPPPSRPPKHPPKHHKHHKPPHHGKPPTRPASAVLCLLELVCIF